MTKATSDDSDESPGSYFSATYVGGVIRESLEEIQRQMNSNADRILYLLPYLAGMYYTDHQRRMAEAQLFSLQFEQERLIEQQRGATSMAVELYRPVYINT